MWFASTSGKIRKCSAFLIPELGVSLERTSSRKWRKVTFLLPGVSIVYENTFMYLFLKKKKYLKLASGREFRGILVLNNGEILVLEGWALHSLQPYIDSYLYEGSFIAWLSFKTMFRKHLEGTVRSGFSYESQLFLLIFQLLWNSKDYSKKHCANFLSQFFVAPQFQYSSWWVSRKWQPCVQISV